MAEKRAKKTTIIEVARLAGVSTATAGRVLGGYGYASQDIREKVRAAAESLGYRPNALARGLITGQTQTIGVVAGDVESPFYASILRGIADVARSKGFGLVVTNSDEIFQREREAVELLVEKQVDGLIVTPSDLASARYLESVIASGCPVVQIDRVVQELAADAVTVDSTNAARNCVAHLIRAGHRRIAMIAELERSDVGDVRSFLDRTSFSATPPVSLYPSWQRLLGYLQAHREAGLPVDPALVRRVGSYSAVAAKEETIDLLSGRPAPTALFTADGLMSAGVMDAVSALRLDIPGDISLACFDDLDWMRFVRPGITAIEQPLNEMGRAAARLVLARIGGESGPPQHLVLPARLSLRNSVRELAEAV
ncbi:LacI family DNA-binding transcriptional regulator [Aureimonas psammosilenae]|uniref:LacI family DNA-binding transcriptional regulator n=1 Tax=Aureimonas psammosilenae TaxID=2495496 RepID=UPI0012607DDD|nr:LacI family DNA-binding transcriptional regulator [Aureimonas psammosilenae]